MRNGNDIEMARRDGEAAKLREYREIAEVCMLAGVPGKAGAFIQAGSTPSQVRAELLAARESEPVAVKGQARPWAEIFKKLGCYKGGGK